LEPSASTEIRFRATVAATNGQIRNSVSVTGTPGKLANPGTVGADTCPVGVRVVRPCLECVKEGSREGVKFVQSLDLGPLSADVHLFWRVTIRNCGDVTLNDVTM